MRLGCSTRVWIVTFGEGFRWRILGSGRAGARILPIWWLQPIVGRVRVPARPEPNAAQRFR